MIAQIFRMRFVTAGLIERFVIIDQMGRVTFQQHHTDNIEY